MYKSFLLKIGPLVRVFRCLLIKGRRVSIMTWFQAFCVVFPSFRTLCVVTVVTLFSRALNHY
jgi:hypothetical protein